ncbi:hypothetical protein FACS1894208_10820 [Clostridia bacterium]|nr:hypothetical protein FACS1894208_10820 [Clostridia bacterium]
MNLEKIWMECFPGDADFYPFFMRELYKPENALLRVEDGEAASMAHLIPQTIRGERAVYVFGVATLKKYRGRGFAGELMRAAIEREERLLLIPQTPDLFGFYRELGFEDAFCVPEFSVQPKILSTSRELDFSALNDIYVREFGGDFERTSEQWRHFNEIYSIKFWGTGYAVFREGKLIEAAGDGAARSEAKKPLGMARGIPNDIYMNLLYY